MNKFEAKQIKLSVEYLQEKLNSVKKEEESIFKLEKKEQQSTIKKIVNSFFK